MYVIIMSRRLGICPEFSDEEIKIQRGEALVQSSHTKCLEIPACVWSVRP